MFQTETGPYFKTSTLFFHRFHIFFPPKQKRVKGNDVIFYQKIARENANCLYCSDKLLTENGKLQKTQNGDGPVMYIFT